MVDNPSSSREKLQAELETLRRRVVELERLAAAADSGGPDQVLQATAAGVTEATGDEFFKLLARHLAESLSCEYAAVGIVTSPRKDRVRTLALVNHQALLDNLEYDLADTPCRTVVDQELCLFPSRVQELFPRDQILADWQAESYAGTPLCTAEGEALGLIWVMSKRPFSNPPAVAAALQIFATRAAAEIERQRAAQSLRLSEERFRQIAENVRDVFWLHDFDQQRLIYISPAYETIWQRPVGWLLEDATRWLEAIHEDDRGWISVFYEAQQSGMIHDQTYRIRRPDGSVRWIHGRRFAVHDAAGRMYRIAGVAEDVTERIEAAEKVASQAAQIAHVARLSSMGELVASIAHEVNQPLHVISVFSSTMHAALAGEGKWDQSDLRKWNEEIAKAAARAAEIIKRLRAYVSKEPMCRTKVDLGTLIRESVELVALETRRSRSQVQILLAPSLPPVIADATGIQQVLVNLLRNALEAMDARAATKRLVAVRVQPTAEGIETAVQDAGSGLTPEALDQLFEPFFTTKPSGMGMGLAISKTIVEAHGGRIWATSNPDGGATFHFVLPIARD